jgi:SAM-dependent methyltransferase
VSGPATPEQLLAAVYDEGAAAYEQFWAPVLHRHARDLVDGAAGLVARGPLRVVDVATGAGTLLPDLRRLAGEGGLVVAADRSLGMLRRVPGIAPRVQADAAALPLASGSVDVVALVFVLFMLPDARRGVVEAARVLRPGGLLLAATWGSQAGTDADVVVREELEAAGAPDFPPIDRSDADTDSPERLAALLGGAFDEVHTDARPLGASFDARSALAMRTGCGVLGWRYARLDPARRAEVTDRVGRRLAGLPPEAFVDRSEVLLTTARRR